MGPVSNKRIILKEYSTGTYTPGRTTSFDGSGTIDLDNVPLNGGVLVKTLLLTVAPGVLALMTSNVDVAFGFQPGNVVLSNGIGVVLRSENPAFQAGDHLHGFYTWEEYAVRNDVEYLEKVENKHNLPWSTFVGVAGYPGMSAYVGWKEYARAKKGEVVFVSSGAGAVGSFVVQLARRDGLKVIASAGSDEKVRFLEEIGADVAFNYKTTKTSDVLAKEGPIDIYWDNVGGETLGYALDAAARRARFIECGMTSTYGHTVTPLPNLITIVVKEISIQGFMLRSLTEKYLDEFNREVPAWIASKEIKYKENETRGLENIEATFEKLLKGEFFGSSIVIVADE